MNIQIFGTKKSSDTRKAERWFKERRIKFQYIDLREKELSKGELRSVAQAVGGLEALIDDAAKDGYGKPAGTEAAHRTQRTAGHGGLRTRRLEDVGIASASLRGYPLRTRGICLWAFLGMPRDPTAPTLP